MAKMTNEQKLEALKGWLCENKIKFIENHKTKAGVKIDLYLSHLNIAVHVSDDDDAAFYKKTCKWSHPFFVRDAETTEFIIEKMQNCVYDRMVEHQRKFEKEQNKTR